jgi:hypothetical protein
MAFNIVIDVDDEAKNSATNAHDAPTPGTTMLVTVRGMPEWQSS